MEPVKLKKSDVTEALDLIWSVFLKFEAPEYTQEGILEFKAFISHDPIMEKIDKGELHFWECRDHTGLTGVIAVRDLSHICLLFVKKEHHRRGIGKSLFEAAKNACMKNGIGSMTVNSSPYAVGFYHRLGFIDTDSEKTVNGIRFTPMAYSVKQE